MRRYLNSPDSLGLLIFPAMLAFAAAGLLSSCSCQRGRSHFESYYEREQPYYTRVYWEEFRSK